MSPNRQQKIEIIIEKKDGMLWGIVENKGNFVATPYGKTKDELITNLKELIKDHQQNEGKKDTYWSKMDAENMEVTIPYHLQAFFKEFKELKISSLAATAKLNPTSCGNMPLEASTLLLNRQKKLNWRFMHWQKN